MTICLRLRKQLTHPKLKGLPLDIEKIQAIVDADEKKRYDLRFEVSEGASTTAVATVDSSPDGQSPVPSSATLAGVPEERKGVWWIKANQGHSMKVCVYGYPNLAK